VILHVDLRRKGELTIAQMLLQFRKERQNRGLTGSGQLGI
jgi:hypothetical protein